MNTKPIEFDDYAAIYDAALNEGISISGESKDFFAHSRIEWLEKRIRELNLEPRIIMDHGCGIGSAAPCFLRLFPNASVVGMDVSNQCLETARQHNDPDRTRFVSFDEYYPHSEIDLVYSNGVFHHIPRADRLDAIDYIYRSLHSGGIFALWENNPWNPGARYVMSRIPFDRDAVMMSALEARRLLQKVGFQILRTDFLFIFPKRLRWFRRIEPFLVRLPLGAQYQVLCRK